MNMSAIANSASPTATGTTGLVCSYVLTCYGLVPVASWLAYRAMMPVRRPPCQ